MDKKTFLTLLTGIIIGILIGYLGAVALDKKENTTPVSSQNTQHVKQDDVMMLNSMMESLQKNPDDVKTRTNLANLLFDTGNYQEAATHYMKVLEKQPNNTSVISDLGVCYRRTGNFEAAREQFTKVTKIEPDHVIGWYNLAVTNYYDFKDSDAAKKALDKVLSIDPFYENAISLKSKIEKSGK